MHLVRSHGLVYVQVPQVVSNLSVSYNGKDLVHPVPALRFRDLRDVGRVTASENRSKKNVEHLSLLHVSYH